MGVGINVMVLVGWLRDPGWRGAGENDDEDVAHHACECGGDGRDGGCWGTGR